MKFVLFQRIILNFLGGGQKLGKMLHYFYTRGTLKYIPCSLTETFPWTSMLHSNQTVTTTVENTASLSDRLLTVTHFPKHLFVASQKFQVK